MALPFLVFESSPRVAPVKQVSPQALKVSERLSKRVVQALSRSSGHIVIYKDELKTALDVVSYSVPQVSLNAELTAIGMQVSASGLVKLGGFERYLNATCILFNGRSGVEFDSCYLGGLSIPGSWVQQTAEYLLANYVGQHAFSTWFQLAKKRPHRW